jgi:hypothetical protein
VATRADVESSGSFSSERAWRDLEALAGVGSRAPGSPGADVARAYISEALGGVGLSVEERVTPVAIEGLEPFDLTHLSVTIPGRYDDRFVLVAGYDSDHFVEFENPGVNLGASGAALLIELARVLANETPEYTVQLLFVEGEGRLGLGERRMAEQRGLGSALLARQMREAGELEGVRLLIAYKGTVKRSGGWLGASGTATSSSATRSSSPWKPGTAHSMTRDCARWSRWRTLPTGASIRRVSTPTAKRMCSSTALRAACASWAR